MMNAVNAAGSNDQKASKGATFKEAYRLRCLRTGQIKMYKHMVERQARTLNASLSQHGSTYAWTVRDDMKADIKLKRY